MLVVRSFVLLELVLLGVGCSRLPLEQEDGGGSGGSGGSSGTIETGSSSESVGLDGDESGVAPSCGNGLVEIEEECDGEDLAGRTCEGLGFDGGTLGCDARCRYDVSACEEPPEERALQLGFSQVKMFDFSWTAVPGADYYQLLESPAPGQPYAPLGGDLVGTSASFEMPLHLRWQASYRLRACDADGCTDTAEVDVVESLAEAVGYVKASNTGAVDLFGDHVALSGDGNTLAVGAVFEDSNATGIGGNQADDSACNSGAVYVFVRDGAGAWSQQAYVKASNTSGNFGRVALSDDGNTLAVGAGSEDSSATGIGGDQVDDSALGAGAVYVFVRDGAGAWSQQAYVKASNTGAGDGFGRQVELSGDGSTLAVAAPVEASSATGIGGDQADDSVGAAGAVYVFVRDGAEVWSQQAYVKASDTHFAQYFGSRVTLTQDGNAIAVVSRGDAVEVFARDGAGVWSQQAYIELLSSGGDVALSGDGNTLAVSANGGDNSGAVYVLVRDGAGAWSQQAYVKESNTMFSDGFSVVALSDDGNTLAVGASGEDSSATGIGGNQTDDSAQQSGAVYLY